MDGNPTRQIAFIEFGEVEGIFGHDFAAARLGVSIFDIPLNAEPMREAVQAVADTGLEPITELDRARRQDWLAQAIAEFSLAVRQARASRGKNSPTLLRIHT
jgi:hypothetical protein